MQIPGGVQGGLSPAEGHFRFVWSLAPLDMEASVERDFEAGMNLSHVVKILKIDEFSDHLVFRHSSGDEIEDWREFVPEAGDVIECTTLPGSTDQFKKVAGVLIVTALIFAGGAFAVGYMGLTGAVGAAATWGLNYLGKAYLVAGLINAFSDDDGDGDRGSIERGASYYLSGGANAPAPWKTVPIVLGERDLAPPLATNSFTEIVGNDQYLNMLLCWGVAPMRIEDLRIGNQPIGNYKDVEITYDLLGEGTLNNFPQARERDVSALITDEWTTRETHPDTDEISLNLIFPRGLYRLDDNGNAQDYKMEYVVQYRKKGTTTWLTADRDNRTKRSTDQILVGKKIDKGIVGYIQDPESCRKVRRTRTYTYNPSGTPGDRETRTEVYHERVCTPGAYRPVHGKLDSKGVWEVRIKRAKAEPDDSRIVSELRWLSMGSFRNSRPVNTKKLALMKVRIKSSNENNGRLGAFNARAMSLIPQYTRAANGRPGGGTWSGGTRGSTQWSGAARSNPSTADFRSIDVAAPRFFSSSSSDRPGGSGNGIMAVVESADGRTRTQLAVYTRPEDGGHRAVTRTMTRASRTASWPAQGWGSQADWNYGGAGDLQIASLDSLPAGNSARVISMDAPGAPPEDKTKGKASRSAFALTWRDGDRFRVALATGQFGYTWTTVPGTGTSALGESTNPGEILREAMLNPDWNPKPLPLDSIDMESVNLFTEHCRTRGLAYSKVYQGGQNVNKLLDEIAGAGMGSLDYSDGRWRVIWDSAKPDEEPVTMITPSNCTQFKGSIVTLQPPHAIRIRFPNEDEDYRWDIRTVYMDGFNAGGTDELKKAVRIIESTIGYITDPDCIDLIGKYQLRVAHYRRLVWEAELGIEHVVFRRGDRVLFAHDAALIGIRSGWIEGIDKGNRRLTLDAPIQFEKGKNYRIFIRRKNSRKIDQADISVAAGDYTREVTVAGEGADALVQATEEGCLCNVGEVQSAMVDCIVIGIDPASQDAQKNPRVRVRLTEYAPGIFQSLDVTKVPKFVSRLSKSAAPTYNSPPKPVLVSIRSDEAALPVTSAGAQVPAIRIDVRASMDDTANETRTLVNFFRVRWRRIRDALGDPVTEEWEARDMANDGGRIYITPVAAKATYEIEIESHDVAAGRSEPLELTHIVEGLSEPPPAVGLLSVENDLLKWTYPNAPGDVAGFRVFHSTTAQTRVSRMASLGENAQALARSYPVTPMTGTYAVQPVDTTGVVGEARFLDYTAPPSPTGRKKALESVQDPSFGGTKSGLAVVSGGLRLAVIPAATISDDLDDWPDLDDLENLSRTTEASYRASGTITTPALQLDAKFACRLEVDLRVSGYNSLQANQGALTEDEIEDYRVSTEFRTASALNNGTPVWGAWEPIAGARGGVVLRYVQFRTTLASNRSSVTPIVDRLRFSVWLDRRSEQGRFTTPGSVTFARAFWEAPEMTWNPALDAGDRLVEGTVTKTGASAEVRNSSNAAQSGRSVGWTATGIGEAL